jgi:Transposase IS200 like
VGDRSPAYRRRMPQRPAIDPQGCYHVSSRGCYGRVLFPTPQTSERFLQMYARVAHKYAWTTVAWVLRHNHHHFVLRLSAGGLSEAMRELHGGYSRWFHLQNGRNRPRSPRPSRILRTAAGEQRRPTHRLLLRRSQPGRVERDASTRTWRLVRIPSDRRARAPAPVPSSVRAPRAPRYETGEGAGRLSDTRPRTTRPETTRPLAKRR